MRNIRQVGEYILLFEPLMSMYRITDGLNYSFWFAHETKFEMMKLSDAKFAKNCKKFIKNSQID